MYTAPSRSNLFSCNSQHGLVRLDVVKRDIKAVSGETESDGTTNSLAGTSHESDTLSYRHITWRRREWRLWGKVEFGWEIASCRTNAHVFIFRWGDMILHSKLEPVPGDTVPITRPIT